MPYNSCNRSEKSVDHSTLSENNEWYSKENKLNQSFRSKSQPDLTRLHKIRTENPARNILGNTR